MEAGTLSLGFSAVPCKSGLADHTGLHPAASTLAHTRPPTPTPLLWHWGWGADLVISLCGPFSSPTIRLPPIWDSAWLPSQRL